MKEHDVTATPLTAPPPSIPAPTVPTAPPLVLTKTEQKFYQLLRDGRPHDDAELTKYLWDELGVNLKVAIAMHMSRMRPKLGTVGEYITTVPIRGVRHYVLIRNPG